jgi:hypothetical protein
VLAPSPFAAAPAYDRHRPEQTALYAIIAEHYPRFVQEIEQSGGCLPMFVRREFEDYLKCGLLEHGVLRVKCDGCHHEHLVAFSCKRRGFCPSCGARRMVESAAHLVDHVFPEAPVRQRRLSWHGGLRAYEQEALPACRPRVGVDLPVSPALPVRQPSPGTHCRAGRGTACHLNVRGPARGLGCLVRRQNGRRYPDPAQAMESGRFSREGKKRAWNAVARASARP